MHSGENVEPAGGAMSGHEGAKKRPLEQTRKQAEDVGQKEKVFKQKQRGADETRGAKANAAR